MSYSYETLLDKIYASLMEFRRIFRCNEEFGKLIVSPATFSDFCRIRCDPKVPTAFNGLPIDIGPWIPNNRGVILDRDGKVMSVIDWDI